MIGPILKLLKDNDIVGTSVVSDYEYYFNNRANINLILYKKKMKNPFLFIKISDLRNFAATFENMKRVYNKLPQILPEPVIFFSLSKYQVLVTKAYNIELLITKHYLSIKKRKMLLHNVISKIGELQLKTIDGFLNFDEEFYQSNLLPKVHTFFRRWEDDDLLQKFNYHLKKLSKYFGTVIPEISQHGDLVMLNVGLIDGKLDEVIFIDWDSYSEVKLPMFDIVIFINTFVNFYGCDMYTESKYIDSIKLLFFEYCDALRIDRNFVMDLYPIYLLLFASLKADIGVFDGQAFAFREMKRFFLNNSKTILHCL